MLKMICFDMDGTIADLYGVKGWLEMLRNEDTTPYEVAKEMWNVEVLNATLMALQAKGIEIRIVTWLSKDSTEEYKTATREAKKEWLANCGFPYDHFHGVRYGATKADAIRKYLADDETAILIDDNAKIRKGWHMGDTIDPTTENILETLAKLLGEV